MAKQKIVLITGASAGIGKATAELLIREGYVVYCAARRVERMADLGEQGGIPVKMDVTKNEDLVRVVEQIERDHGGVDILINNAGISVYGSVEETEVDAARYQFEVDLFGVGRLTQLILPSMRKRGAGKIVNISSGEGKIYGPLAAWYVASKFALEGFSDCLRVETKKFGIDIIIIEPGAIATDIYSGFIDPLIKRSGSGPYAPTAKKMADWFRNLESNPGGASPPSVIADTILLSIRARKPKTRYAAGKMVREFILARAWLGDRMFDRMIDRYFS